MATQSTLRNPWKPYCTRNTPRSSALTTSARPLILLPFSRSTSATVRQRTWVRKRRKVPPDALGFVNQLPERLLP
jgi:hypothetical protein